jgi:hypothetical protein
VRRMKVYSWVGTIKVLEVAEGHSFGLQRDKVAEAASWVAPPLTIAPEIKPIRGESSAPGHHGTRVVDPATGRVS